MLDIQERRRRCRELIDRYYGDLPTREDVLHAAVMQLIKPSDVLLDAGCGSTVPLLARYGPRTRTALGIDVCPLPPPPTGTYLASANLEALPLRAESVDLIVSRSVVEHLERPRETFAEFARVLRPEGHIVFTTPNLYYYSCFFAAVTPPYLKRWYFKKVFGEDAYDHFPVQYRANTRGALGRIAAKTGLRVDRAETTAHYPFYLMFSPLLFRLGVAYDMAVEAFHLYWLRSSWLVVMRKG